MNEVTIKNAAIPADAILRFLDRLEASHIPMHSILLMHRGRLAAEGYYAPYKKDTLHRMFSICKSLNALAVGLLEAEGKLSLEDKIADYFPDKVPANAHPWITSMTIRNLLMMRTCHASTTYKYNASVEWIESFFTTPPTHKPGTVFHYDTSAAHVLCMLVQRVSGMPMLDFLRERVLNKIGWSKDAYVLDNPFGEPQGGSGLMCTPRDLLLLGKLLLQHGEWEGEQLLPREFTDTAVSCLTPNSLTGPVISEAQGYGYQIWRTEHNGFVCYGMGGQLVICLPDYDLICVTTADTQGISGGNQLIYNSFYEEILPALDSGADPSSTSPAQKEQAKAADRRLAEKLASLKLQPVCIHAASAFGSTAQSSQAQVTLLPQSLPVAHAINGRVYTFMENAAGFTNMSLHLEEKQGKLAYFYQGNHCEIVFGLEECREGIFPVYELACVGSGAWIAPDTFYLKCHITDTSVGSVHMELVFGEDDITVFMKKVEETMLNEYNCHLYGRIS